MKMLLIFLALGMGIPPFVRSESGGSSVEYKTYSNPRWKFEIKCPGSLPLLRRESGLFTFGNNQVHLSVSVLPDEGAWTWKIECKNQLDFYSTDPGSEVTYKVFRDNFMVLSGNRDESVFYIKEIPFNQYGNRFILRLEMKFPQPLKMDWDPRLAVISNSLKFTRGFQGVGISSGWKETGGESEMDRLLRMAENWVKNNVKCFDKVQTGEEGPQGEPDTSPCGVDMGGAGFINLTDGPITQFIIGAHGPFERGRFFNGDYKYILFTYREQKISGQIFYQIGEGEYPGQLEDTVQGLECPEGGKLLVLEIPNSNCGAAAHVFKYFGGTLGEVLKCDVLVDECRPGTASEGFEARLVPVDNGQLKLMKHKWVLGPLRKGEEGADDGRYYNDSEVLFNYDPGHQKFVQVGEEKDLTKVKVPKWNN